ncbi:WhiB family transcriptional regulator [Kitasatospora sp. NBC_01302]|uniref:WhiB family transcriptional regulator n=1 Tax=Kitasatospora sp. NBC_01302 TaxID=2903575 RepID=UPI002E10C87D|nr:WhiB family transcriptional regulator [Kitasatospora sp. NBC_01302]
MPQDGQRGEPNRRPCTDYPADHFFPETETKGGKPSAGEAAALRVCASCPLATRGACLEDALRFKSWDQHGVVGGTTAAQRRLIVRSRRAARTVQAPLAEVA